MYINVGMICGQMLLFSDVIMAKRQFYFLQLQIMRIGNCIFLYYLALFGWIPNTQN